jgi:hypothetical protein
MVVAAKLTDEETAKQSGYSNHLTKMQTVPGLTVEEFMKQFKDATKDLAKEQRDLHDAEAYSQSAGATAKSQAASQAKVQSVRLQNEARNDPARYKDEPAKDAKPQKLAIDPVGKAPEIRNTGAAAPKPKAREEISLDDKSQALDDALANHTVHGQAINIDEGSLALSVSGEPSFDEAGEAKRKAQDEIKKLIPRYRTQEKTAIAKSEADIQTTVDKGLEFHHGTRGASFGQVLGKQNEHKTSLEGKKRGVLSLIEDTYNKTRNAVEKELRELPDPNTVLDGILKDAQEYFNDNARKQLEYIYVPGMLDYSDWKGLHEKEIAEEYEKQKRRSEESEGYRLVDPAYLEALKIVRDRSAAQYFEIQRSIFISNVNWGVEQKIAKPVVDALNKAKQHIREGDKKVRNAFASLRPQEQVETKALFDAVTNRFAQLEESVDDKRREIIGDLARTYNQSLGKLQSTFDEIKKDVLTSWWEKAWNKLKAIVNAIIDFASRIVELLGRLAYLVGDIVTSPRAFFRNLANGISTGFSTFIGDIGGYLATAFFDWLRGSSGVAVRMPPDMGPAGIFSLFTQLLDLSAETVWLRMEVAYGKPIANAFRRGEAVFEKGLEIFTAIRDKGLGGLWDEIQNSLGSILEDTLETIKEDVLYAAIKKVILEIGKLLVPGGGFIAIAEKVIRLFEFIVTARDKILDLIEAFVTSAEMAVKGDIGGIVDHITSALTKFITIALDFLVTFFGLGDIKNKVTRFIGRMRAPVIRGIDWVLAKFKPTAQRVYAKVFGKKESAKPGEIGDVRHRAATMAASQIKDNHTREEALAILSSIEAELKPAGLKSLRAAAPNEKGITIIYAEASPSRPLLELLDPGFVPSGRSVVMVARLHLWRPVEQDFEELKAEKATTKASKLGISEGTGGVVAPGEFKEKQYIDVVTWNTSNINSPATSHAEYQFLKWIESKEKPGPAFLASISAVEVNMKDMSPCGDCSRFLVGVMQTLTRARRAERRDPKVAPHVPETVTGQLVWTKLYTGSVKAGVPPTTYSNLSDLQKAHWQLFAPAKALPTTDPHNSKYVQVKLINDD